MSIARALSNAMSGLTATARGTETVAANMANAMTPGYARRELAVSVQTLGGNGGGVRLDGVTRVVNASLVAESRLAGSASAEAGIRLNFQSAMEKLVGLPGETGALATLLGDFRTALQSASARPDDEIRLGQVVIAADRLTKGLNAASNQVQKSRQMADQAIAADVATLSASLERVAYLNRRISILESNGSDPLSLIDERALVVDQISKIVPIQEVAREAGKIALFTIEGAVLLDGTTPTELSFTYSGELTADSVVGSGSVTRLFENGQELSASQMRPFAGGSLSANFAIRDDLAPQLQQELDALAFELHERLADPSVDPSITATDPGLFTDAGSRADVASVAGLAARLQLNDSVRPESGGALWRIRSGAGAVSSSAVGDSTYLNALANALEAVGAPLAGSGFDGNASFAARLASVESRVATRRVNAEADAAVRNSRAETISSRLMADGVDSDAEMQRLLEYEQAYAANARVIQAINEMMDQILRL